MGDHPDVAFARRLLPGPTLLVGWGGRPRAVVPAGPRPARVRAVGSVPAFSPAARGARAGQALRAALAGLVGGPATPDEPSTAPLAGVAPWPDVHPVAVWLGTPHPARHVLVPFADAAGRPVGVAKIATGPRAAAGVAREAAALADPTVAAWTPPLDGRTPVEGRATLWLAHVPGRPPSRRAEDTARILGALRPTPGAPASGVLDRSWVRAALDAAGLRPDPFRATLPGARPHVRMHGDLAPWNVRLDGPRTTFLDWEESRPDGLEGVDGAHHLLAASLHLDRATPAGAVARAAATLRRHGGWGEGAALALVALAAAWRVRRARRDGVPETPLGAWSAAAQAAASALEALQAGRSTPSP